MSLTKEIKEILISHISLDGTTNEAVIPWWGAYALFASGFCFGIALHSLV